jgi:hypothetical protein
MGKVLLLIVCCLTVSILGQDVHPMRQVVEDIYSSAARGDFEPAVKAFSQDPNFVWDTTHSLLSPQSPLYGTWKGEVAYSQFNQISGQLYDISEFSYKIITVGDHGAVVHLQLRLTCKATGKTSSQLLNAIDRLHFHGGKISKVELFLSEAAEVENLCVTPEEEFVRGAFATGLHRGTLIPPHLPVATNLSVTVTSVARHPPFTGTYDYHNFTQLVASSDFHEPTHTIIGHEGPRVSVELDFSKWSIKTAEKTKQVWKNLKAIAIYTVQKREKIETAAPGVEPTGASDENSQNGSAVLDVNVDQNTHNEEEVVIVVDERSEQKVEPQTQTESGPTYEVGHLELVWIGGEYSSVEKKKKVEAKSEPKSSETSAEAGQEQEASAEKGNHEEEAKASQKKQHKLEKEAGKKHHKKEKEGKKQ